MIRNLLKSSFLKQHLLYKILLSFILILTIISISYWPTSKGALDPRQCFLERKENHYHKGHKDFKLLEDVMTAKRKPTPGKTIFFHETSCSNEYIKLNPRQACAIESAAKMNPLLDIFLLFASPVSFNNDSLQSFVEVLLTYPNIHLRNVNLWTYSENTPIIDWIQDGQLFQSKYLNSHISDFLRYLTLYKWGGTYLDLDVIVQKNLDEVLANYAGAESDKFVAAGILNFEHEGTGHEIAEMCLREFQVNFNGEDWGNNGPGVITRVLQYLCQTKSPALMKRRRCRGFNVYPENAFYAVQWRDWKYFFLEKFTNKTLELTENSVAIHVWNKHSKSTPVKVGSKVAYGIIAEKYCPKVYSSCGKYF